MKSLIPIYSKEESSKPNASKKTAIKNSKSAKDNEEDLSDVLEEIPF